MNLLETCKQEPRVAAGETSGAARRLFVFALALAAFGSGTALAAAPLKIVTTTTDLASIARTIGGDKVEVKSLANGVEDPHYIQAKPGFIRDLARADVFIQNGLDLETGWAPVLLKNCRNRKVLPGSSGFVDASSAIQPIQDKLGDIDRSMGDVHARGNPHYMVDPVSGILVTNYIGERLGKISPADRALFARRSADLQKKIAAGLWGAKIANGYPPTKLAQLQQRGGAAALLDFLGKQKRAGDLGGWMSRLAPVRGGTVIVEHRFWPYFSRTFGLRISASMEPIPGVDPTTAHLKKVVESAKADGSRVILALPYFPSKHARFVSENTGAKIARMAHMPQARPGTEDYYKMLDYNVSTLSAQIGR